MAYGNALIPMAVDVPDIAGAYFRGQQMYGAQQEMQNQNALRAAMQQYGPAAMRGDQNALAQLAQFDPQLGLSMMGDQQAMDLRGRADVRAERESASGLRLDEARLGQIRESQRMAAAQHAMQMDAATREREAVDSQREAAMLTMAYKSGPEEWARVAPGILGGKTISFEDAPYIIAGAQGSVEGLIGENSEYYGTAVWAKDAQGKDVVMQLGKDGVPKQVEFGDGLTPQPPTKNLDLGTEVVVQGPGGVARDRLAKDVRGEKSEGAIGTAIGEATGEAITGLGAVEAKAQQAVGLIDSILANPEGIASITGASVGEGIGGMIPPITQVDQDMVAKLQQLQGQVFLEAYESLRGAQGITNIEGEKAERAKARLQRPQSAYEFTLGLKELREVINSGLTRARQKAASGTGQAPSASEALDDNALFEKYGITP